MTFNQLHSLSEDELGMILVIVNHVSPQSIPKVELTAENLLWFRHEFLVRKIVDAFPSVLPEAYPTYVSLLKKLDYEFILPEPPACTIAEPIAESVNDTLNKE